MISDQILKQSSTDMESFFKPVVDNVVGLLQSQVDKERATRDTSSIKVVTTFHTSPTGSTLTSARPCSWQVASAIQSD